jgi:hypothetical protein
MAGVRSAPDSVQVIRPVLFEDADVGPDAAAVHLQQRRGELAKIVAMWAWRLLSRALQQLGGLLQ